MSMLACSALLFAILLHDYDWGMTTKTTTLYNNSLIHDKHAYSYNIMTPRSYVLKLKLSIH